MSKTVAQDVDPLTLERPARFAAATAQTVSSGLTSHGVGGLNGGRTRPAEARPGRFHEG
jgi:hypothetical protein